MADLNNLAEDRVTVVDEHFVQFYDSENFLIESLTNFVSAGFIFGETVLILATKQHLNALRTNLSEHHFHLNQLQKQGRFVPLNAEEVQADLSVDGILCRERFNQFFSSLLSQATDGGKRVRVFGELVAVLWAQGKYSTALEVEELWNGLRSQTDFSLFCAYPMQAFAGKEMAEPLRQVCLTHSRIIPAESYSSLNGVDEKLHTIAGLQQQSISLMQEIAEHERTQQQLKEALQRERLARAEVESANRLKDEFLATVSHELRTPLNVIVGWSHLLNQGHLDQSTSTKAMESIERNANVEAQMIDNLLDLSTLSAGTLRLDLGEVDIPAVVKAAINLLRRAADAKEIEVTIQVDSKFERIVADARRLEQIFWHLLDNAIKFTPANGRVSIHLRQDETDVEVSVQDTGQGIERNLLTGVFERFRQADSGTTRRHGGMGLGLSIVRYLVELHGGSVFVESEGVKLGSRFVVRLPNKGKAMT